MFSIILLYIMIEPLKPVKLSEWNHSSSVMPKVFCIKYRGPGQDYTVTGIKLHICKVQTYFINNMTVIIIIYF